MKVHEYQAKEIFSRYEIPVERHVVCNTPDEAVKAFRELKVDRVAIKAQVLTGGRGKAGGVKLADNEEAVRKYAAEILDMTIKGFRVKRIIVSEAVSIDTEYYVSFTIDRNSRSVVLIMSAAGGMDIEEVARTAPEKIVRYNIDSLMGFPDYLAQRFAYKLFDQAEQARRMASILQSLYKAFIKTDASLAEINPLVLSNRGTLIAIDAKMVFDDNALYRQPDIRALFDPTPEEELEAKAKERGFSYVRMDGDIGCMVNGAGLAMATMDMIKLYGGSPANFLDIGGSSNPEKVVDAMKILLSDANVKAVFINIFGGITRGDDIAMGLIQAFGQIETDMPVVVRLTGTNENIGRKLLTDSNRFLVAETMNEGTMMAVKSVKGDRL